MKFSGISLPNSYLLVGLKTRDWGRCKLLWPGIHPNSPYWQYIPLIYHLYIAQLGDYISPIPPIKGTRNSSPSLHPNISQPSRHSYKRNPRWRMPPRSANIPRRSHWKWWSDVPEDMIPEHREAEVLVPLNNISQIGSIRQIGMNIKDLWHHHLE